MIKKLQENAGKLAGLAIAGGLGAVALVGSAFATPAYVIDTGVQSGITDLLSSFISGAYLIIVVAIGLVGGYYVTIKLVHILLKWFHKFA